MGRMKIGVPNWCMCAADRPEGPADIGHKLIPLCCSHRIETAGLKSSAAIRSRRTFQTMGVPKVLSAWTPQLENTPHTEQGHQRSGWGHLRKSDKLWHAVVHGRDTRLERSYPIAYTSQSDQLRQMPMTGWQLLPTCSLVRSGCSGN